MERKVNQTKREMTPKEGDLVLLRLTNDDEPACRKRHYNTWFRVMFIDLDNTFIGKVERIEKYEFTRYKIGEDIRLPIDKILQIYTEGNQWCYSDNVTICECSGLCRNK